ncbi:MAG TPA: GNAT family N-acetyltransferase, partial [Candidatus Thermoplasmatota archaeon]|nr:GNAT family N-acetyltransferase [Candidatus Thermoplasmatota archaeon]
PVLYPRGLPPRERVDAWLAQRVSTPPRIFLVHVDGGADPVGYAGIQPLPETGEPELFYAMRGAAWGRGYATEACEAVLAHARGALRLPRLVAVVLPSNRRSARVLEKLGFRAVGTTEHAGLPHARYERGLGLTSS